MFYRRDPEVDAAARVHPPLLGNAPAPLRFIMTRCACRTESKPVLLYFEVRHPSPSVHTLFCAIEEGNYTRYSVSRLIVAQLW